jgi:phage terminase small subunit
MSKKDFTPRQNLFIKNYIVYKNATKAAKLSDYSVKTAYSQGQRLLKNVEIAEAIQRGLNEQLYNVAISAEEILDELSKIAFDPCYGGNYSSKLKALEILGKCVGLIKDRNDATINSHSGPKVVLTTTADGQKSYREMSVLDSIIPCLKR